MHASEIGHVRYGAGKRAAVRWNRVSGDVYVAWAGWTWCGKASSATHAMDRAAAYLHDKR